MIPWPCFVVLILFIIWAVYVQVIGWRRSKGMKGMMEMSLVDRVHDEMIYQFGYKRNYKIMWKISDEGYWMLKDTTCPRWKARLLVIWSFVQVLFMPYSYRTLRVEGFDDHNPLYIMEEVKDGEHALDNG